MPSEPHRQAQRGLSRERLVDAALALVDEDGLDALSMRALADRLNVKAASIYWHVRDRRELLELLAQSILDSVHGPRAAGGWRAAVTDLVTAVARRIGQQMDAARILLEAPDSLPRSAVFARMKGALVDAGLAQSEATEVVSMLMAHVIAGAVSRREAAVGPGTLASIAVDSGSRGVVLRRGSSDMDALVAIPHDQGAAAPAVVRGETVKVRRLRGVGRGDIALNPRHPWQLQVQGPTWNTLLDLAGLDVRLIKLDSGAAKVECRLPAPRGVVPIIVSGGVVGVMLHRPPGVAVGADVNAGAVRLKLDASAISAVAADLRWESEGASRAADRYELRIKSGAVHVTLDEAATADPPDAHRLATAAVQSSVSALDILLDGVEARLARAP